MNLPNKLTILRIVLAFIFMGIILVEGLCAKALALLIFSLASLTDYFDGKIARSRGLVTSFGKLMDPIADKLLMLAAFLAFVELELVPAWMVVVIIAREFLITGVRLFAASKGKVLAAAKAGKHKTISQAVVIVTALVFLIAEEILKGVWSPHLSVWLSRIIYGMMLWVVAITVISGVSFFRHNGKLLFKRI